MENSVKCRALHPSKRKLTDFNMKSFYTQSPETYQQTFWFFFLDYYFMASVSNNVIFLYSLNSCPVMSVIHGNEKWLFDFLLNFSMVLLVKLKNF